MSHEMERSKAISRARSGIGVSKLEVFSVWLLRLAAISLSSLGSVPGSSSKSTASSRHRI